MTDECDASEVACALVLRALHEPIEGVAGLDGLIPVVASLNEDASPVLLDGLVRLASSNDDTGTIKRIALQALLLCAARSEAAWNLIVIKNRLSQNKHMFPQFAALVAQAYIAPSTSEDEAGMQLRRNLDTFKGAVDLALRGALVHNDGYDENETGNGNRAQQLLRVLLSRASSSSPSSSSSTNLFHHVQSSTLIDTLMVLANSGMLHDDLHMESFMKMIVDRFKHRIPSITSARVHITLKAVAPHLVSDWDTDGVFSRMLTAEGICRRKNPEDVKSTEEAFNFALSERSSHSAARVKRVPDEFVDGAYIAYPEAFDENSARKIRLDDTTRWLRSRIDDDLDLFLRNVLRSVPSLSRIYISGTSIYMESTANPSFNLQHILENHPELVRRRSQDITACLYTIIDGLDDSEERYEPVVMEAILSLVQVMSRINVNIRCDGLWRRFLLDEGRDKNGIPPMFAEITLAFLTGLVRGRTIEADMRKELYNVEKGRGTDLRIREAIRAILSSTT